MRVRRTATASLVTAFATAGLLALAGPALAGTAEPTPAATDDGGVVDPAGNPDCFFVTPGPDEATDEPTGSPTAEPTGDVTADPGGTATPDPEVTDEPTSDVTDEPTSDVTDEPTSDVTDEPTSDVTDEPTDEPSPGPTPTGHYVCLAYTGPLAGSVPPAQGAGAPQLPFSGAPVGRYAETGLALVLAGAGTVLLAARRRSSSRW